MTWGGLLYWAETRGARWRMRDLRDALPGTGAFEPSRHYVRSARLRGGSLLVLVAERTNSGRPINGHLYLSRDMGLSFESLAWPEERTTVRAIDSATPTFTEPYPASVNSSV